MSRKHFKALAAELKFTKPSPDKGDAAMIQWRSDVRAVSRVCDRMNPSFDAPRFLEACGYDPDNW